MKLMFLKNLWSSKKILLLISLLFLNLLIISPAFAAAGDYTPLVKIPGINVNAGLLPYLNGVYIFLISIVGILAMAVLVYGGMRYITSVGNTASIEEAKDSINSALIGLVLALISWLIFNTINADILVLKPVGVGLPSEKYRDAGKTNMCTAAPGSGTQASPCKCIDNPDVSVYKLNTGTTPSKIVSLAINPANPTASVGYTISGDLKDAVTNAPIAGKLLRINLIKSDLSSSNSSFSTTTDGAGHFGWFQTSRACISSERVEVVFDGDNTFASAEANLSYIITGPAGTPQCGDFPTAPGVSILSSSGNDCNSICSDKNLASDGAYHCIKADLRAGLSPNTRVTPDYIEVKAGDIVYFDAATYAISAKPIVRYSISFSNGFLSNFISGWGCNVVNNTCTLFPITSAWIVGCACDGIDCVELAYTAGDYRASAVITDADCNVSAESVVNVKVR